MRKTRETIYHAAYAGSAAALLTTILPAILPKGGPSNQTLGALALTALAGLPLASQGRGSPWKGALLGALFWAASLIAGTLAGGLAASGMGAGPGQLARNIAWYALRGLIGGLAASVAALRLGGARGALAGGLVFVLTQLSAPSIAFSSSAGALAWKAPSLALGVAGATLMVEEGLWPGLGLLAAGNALLGASPLVGGAGLMPRMLGGVVALGVVLAAAGASAPRAVGARVRGALAYGAVLLVPLLLLAASGARVVVVTSGSMEPSLGVGDLAVVLPGSPGPGSVVLYRHEGGLVIHRVVEDHGSYLVTRGDANPGPDPWRVGAGSVVGVMRLRVPWAGRPLLWLRAVLGGL